MSQNIPTKTLSGVSRAPVTYEHTLKLTHFKVISSVITSKFRRPTTI